MRIIAIRNVERKDAPIYYRLAYTGIATIELSTGTNNYRVDFTIEMTPLGGKKIAATFLDGIDYPLVPVMKAMKDFIEAAHANGELPD